MALGVEILLDHPGGPRKNTRGPSSGEQQCQNQRDTMETEPGAMWVRDRGGRRRLLPQNLHRELGSADSLRPPTPSTTREQMCVALSRDVCSDVFSSGGGLTQCLVSPFSPTAGPGSPRVDFAFYSLMKRCQPAPFWVSGTGPAGDFLFQ